MEFANDTEVMERREQLINTGVITEGNPIKAFNDFTAEDTREYFINQGTIKPVGRLNDEPIYSPIHESKKYPRNTLSEEGEYKATPIITEEDYQRKKALYFRMMQELLVSRAKCGLVLGKKELNDPEWYF
jgi:hypothetical protein